MFSRVSLLLAVCILAVAAVAQQPASPTTDQQQAQPPSQQVEPTAETPTFRVNVVQRTTRAVDYRDRGGTTQVDIQGTTVMPQVNGRARVTGHTGRLAIDASFRNLKPARSLGPEYLTYVLWAITSEGRGQNLGEVIPGNDGDAAVQVSTALQEFGLILTAEPYFAVTQPGDLVVAENIIRQDTKGWERTINANFEAVQRGQYTVNIPATRLPSANADPNTPLQLLEAENAIAIAEAAGAEQYAGDTLAKARDYLARGRDYYRRKQGTTPIGTVARAAAQAAEDARLLTIQKKQAEATAAERQRAQERIQHAQTQAEAETARAEQARLDAQREAEQRRLAEQERQAAEQARQEAEQARLQAEQIAQQAAQAQQQTQQQLQQAEAARQAALQQQQQYAQQAQQAQLAAQQAEQEKERIRQEAEASRARLLQQLNTVLQTKDTARGLIVNMSDVLFDTGKATLKPGARLRLAKLAGIILAYPDLKLQIEGYTDSVGSEQFNQVLSQRRAATVRDFLIAQGVPLDNVSAQGLGESNPVATNATAAGRQMNRRVEIIVNGEAITASRTAPGSTGTTSGVAGSVDAANPASSPSTSTVQRAQPSQPAVAQPTQPAQPPASSQQPQSPTPPL